MSDQQLDALLIALSVTPYEDRATRDALLTAMEALAAAALQCPSCLGRGEHWGPGGTAAVWQCDDCHGTGRKPSGTVEDGDAQ